MNYKDLEKKYINGEYQKLVNTLVIKNDNAIKGSHDEIENAIVLSYLSRSLIRLGRIDQALFYVNPFEKQSLSNHSSITDLINESSLVNFLITHGESKEVISRFNHFNYLHLNEKLGQDYPHLLEFFGSYYLYLIGIAYYYELDYDMSRKCYLESIKLNKTNHFIAGKCYYYIAFLYLEHNDVEEFEKYLDKAMVIYEKFNALQGIGWIQLWKGNLLIQRGEYKKAETKLDQALQIFQIIEGDQEIHVIKSLFGLINYQKGNIEESKQLLNESFTASIKLGNPMLSSYILLPFIYVNLEDGNRKIIEENLKIFEELPKDSRVEFHLILCKAVFLKSSPKFIDKAEAEKLFKNLLDKSKQESNYLFLTGDKSLEFFLTINLAEIYNLEFQISKDLTILKDIRNLFDNFKRLKNQERKNEIIEISIINSKLLIAEEKLDEAMSELESARNLAYEFNYANLIEKIDKELKRIYNDVYKWGTNMDLTDKLRALELDSYIKEAQKFTNF